MISIKNIGFWCCISLMGWTTAQAQEQPAPEVKPQGEVIMTQEELTAFLKAVAQARLQKVRGQEMQLRWGYAQRPMLPPVAVSPSSENVALWSEIQRLQQQLTQLQGQSASVNRVQIMPAAAQPSFLPQTTQNKETSSQGAVEMNQTQKSDDAEQLKASFEALKQQLESSKASSAQRMSALEQLLATYGNFKKQIFFANNSTKVSAEFARYIEEVAEVLAQNAELSVVLEGYASPVGKAAYNKALSMRRAEAVQQLLLQKGVTAGRIISGFKGEDTSVNETLARRVDISIVIKR